MKPKTYNTSKNDYNKAFNEMETELSVPLITNEHWEPYQYIMLMGEEKDDNAFC